IPALRAVLPPPSLREIARDGHTSWWDGVVTALARSVLRQPGLVLAGAIFLLVLAVAGASRINTDNALRSYFLPSQPARQDDAFLNAHLAGTNALELVVEGPEDSMKSPAVLRAMQATQAFLQRESAVGKTVSLVDFIRQIDRAINHDDDLERPLPSDPDLIAQYLLLYSMSGDPHDFDAYVDAGYSKALIRAWLRREDSSYLVDLQRRLNAFIKATFPPGITVAIGGNVMSPVALNEVLVSSKLWNIAQIGMAVFLICSLLFRSLLGGALVLVPLGMAVICNFGLMGWTGIPLQLATATVSAMGVGIGADYAIYLLYRTREEAARHDPQTALLRAFQSAGKAVMYVSTAIAGGYAVMMLSWGFRVHFWLGLLISVAMLVSAGAALTMLPALLMLLRPRFVFNARARHVVPVAAPILLALLLLGAGSAAAQNPSPDAIMQRNFVVSKVKDSKADATFTLISTDGQRRVRRTETWTKLEPDGIHNSRLVRFLSPPDVRGTATLTIEHASTDDDIWIYLPALKRVRRLLAENKKDSYVGTDFSYGDIIGFRVEDWTHKLVRQEKVGGVDCFVVESTPVSPAVLASNGYARRLEWIRIDNFVTVRAEFFDSQGRLWKRFSDSDLREVDPVNHRWQPMHLEVEDVQTGHRTQIDFENFVANQGLSDDLFSPRELDRAQ
ncbi:MAG TPA: outer membrane lipoprotein-sorting protein, partial [Mycobacterium sp.]|nr:outer membrane lipoprotein-sorting protein [Mycobacterium sp.]